MERGGVWEAGGRNWRVGVGVEAGVGLPTQALGPHELGSSLTQHPTVILALPWNTLCVVLLINNQAFSCKTQTTQPGSPWI